jgi:hypothetical protein
VNRAGVQTFAEHTFHEVILGHTLEIQRLAWRVRNLILDSLPVVVEVCWPRQGTAGYGIGPTS